MDAEERYATGIERLPKGTHLHAVHPASGLTASDEDRWPSPSKASDLDIAWLAREREEQREVHRAYLAGLAQWMCERDACSFTAELPDAHERAELLRLPGVAPVRDAPKKVEGRLSVAVVERLLDSRVGELLTFERQQLRLVADGWTAVGIWLTDDEARELRFRLADVVRPHGEPSVWRRRGARVYRCWQSGGDAAAGALLALAVDERTKQIAPATLRWTVLIATLVLVGAIWGTIGRRIRNRWFGMPI